MTIQNLLETSVPKSLQHIPEKWEHHSEVDEPTKQKIAMAMRGNNFTHFPLPETRSEPDPDVIEHLFKHGYDVHDYEKGIASKVTKVGDPSRGIPLRDKIVHEKIGSVLEKTGADQVIKSAFMNDPSRSATRTNTSNLRVVVSTSPLAIAGMSTGTNWDDKSCMNLVKGGNSHYLEDDSRHGTHIAYLVHGSDHTALEYGEPQHPIARIALKPYHAMTETGQDTIFLPENKTWGMEDSRFTNAVSDWAHLNYPAKIGHTYKKSVHVYDDSGNRYHKEYTQDEFNNAIHNDDIPRDISVSHDMVSNSIKNTEGLDPKTRTKHLLTISKLNGLSSKNISHIVHLSKKLNEYRMDDVLYSLGRTNGDRLPKSALRHFEEYGGIGIPDRVLMNPRLPDSVLNTIPAIKYQYVRHSKLKPQHIDKLVNEYIKNPSDVSDVIGGMASKLTTNHINNIIDKVTKNQLNSTSFISHSPHFNKQLHNKWINTVHESENFIRQDFNNMLEDSPHASVDDIHKFKTKNGLFSLINNKHLSGDEMKRIKDYFVNKAVNNTEVREGKLTKYIFPHETTNGFHQNAPMTDEYIIPEHLSKHFTDRDYSDLANKKYALKFANTDHSNSYLDAIRGHIIAADTNGNEAAVKNHLSTYLASIHKHLVNHGGFDRYANNINKEEFERGIERMDSLIRNDSENKIKTIDVANADKFKTISGSIKDYYNNFNKN